MRAVFGESQVGPYEVLGLIGEGGMGTVYRVYDPAFRRTVALKVIRSNRLDDSRAQSRFRLEWQLAARLEHDHIVPVFDAGQDGDRLFYTMRYIQGRNLAEVIDRRPLPNHQAAGYIEQVARAVDYAHREMVLHRDLKPSNILIDSLDRAYVTDFGLAKVLGRVTQAATQSTDRLGTLAYMAPEQARDPTRAVNESDVYSPALPLRGDHRPAAVPAPSRWSRRSSRSRSKTPHASVGSTRRLTATSRQSA